MAMKAKEGLHHHRHRRENSSSAASSPQSINAIHTRQTSTDSTDCREFPSRPRKPTPNYLKPTISSGHNICPYAANKKSASDTPATTVKWVRRRSTDKLSSSPSSSHQPLRPRAPKPAISSRPLSLKTNKSETTSQSSKATRTPKKKRGTDCTTTEINPTEKVLSIDVGSGAATLKDEDDHSSRRGPRVTKDDDGLNDGDEHYEASGESLAGGEEGDAGRMRARRVKNLSAAEAGIEGRPRRPKLRQEREEEEEEEEGGRAEEEERVVLKGEEGKEKRDPPAAYNEVIEETASKLAGKRRSKVAALVGAFETVISLQEEPELGQPQQQEEVAAEDEVKLVKEAVVDNGGEERGDGAVAEEEEAGEVGDGEVAAAAVGEEGGNKATNELTESTDKGGEHGIAKPVD